MPGIIKVKVLGAKDLPVMDRASDLTDAFVEVRHGTTVHKTDVCRKSLNPVWNSDWLRFEADDEQLQDEPLQVKILDYDMYSAHDTIGKVMIGLSSLILKNGTNELRGWFPIYDTLHGIRGYIQIFVKIEFFVDANKYRQTSCGIRFFSTSAVPIGFTAVAIQGFVDVLVVNDDPEYQWIDKIRTPRASNDARIRLFSKLSGEVNRRLGLKVIEAGGNAVIGYCQYFDIEGDTGIVVRGIGTSVSLIKNDEANSAIESLTNSPDTSSQSLAVTSILNDPIQLKTPFEKVQKIISNRQSIKHRTLSSRYGRTISTSSDGNENINEASMLLNSSSDSPDISHMQDYFLLNLVNGGLKSRALDDIEFPFFTITKPPPGFVLHIGGTVSSKSVKLLDEINNPDDPETREAWWNEIRTEIRSHAKALACHAVIGYTESTTICDDLMILSAFGTAAIVRLPDLFATDQEVVETADFDMKRTLHRKISEYEQDEEDQKLRPGRLDLVSHSKPTKTPAFDCRVCHVPFVETDLPFSMNLSKCTICRVGKVPDVIFATVEPPPEAALTGTGSLIQARVYRTKKRDKDEANAENVSQILPFLEYELHRQMLNKLKVKSLNSVFGLKMQISVGENVIIGLMTGTAMYLTALPLPPLFVVSGGKGDNPSDEKKLVEMQKKIIDETTKNRARMNLIESLDIFGSKTPPNTPVFNIGGCPPMNENVTTREDVQGNLDLTHGVKETYVVTVDDNLEDDILPMLTESYQIDGAHAFNTETTPGVAFETGNAVQFLTMFHRKKLSEDDLKINTIFAKICEDLILAMHFRLRKMKPYHMNKISYSIKIPEDNDLQVSVTAFAVMQETRKFAGKIRTPKAVHGSLESEELLFPLDVSDTSQLNEGKITLTKPAGGKLKETAVDLAQTWPSTQFNDTKTLLFIHGVQHHDIYSEQVMITPLSEVPGKRIEQYLGNLNLFFIRETTSVKEDGGLNMFMQSFVAEVHAIVRAQVAALGGDGIVSFSINDITLLDSSHKNQGQCLLNVSGDVIKFFPANDEDAFSDPGVAYAS